jgi:hypothetical protein
MLDPEPHTLNACQVYPGPYSLSIEYGPFPGPYSLSLNPHQMFVGMALPPGSHILNARPQTSYSKP